MLVLRFCKLSCASPWSAWATKFLEDLGQTMQIRPSHLCDAMADCHVLWDEVLVVQCPEWEIGWKCINCWSKQHGRAKYPEWSGRCCMIDLHSGGRWRRPQWPKASLRYFFKPVVFFSGCQLLLRDSIRAQFVADNLIRLVLAQLEKNYWAEPTDLHLCATFFAQ